jgi:hypothetical protein
MRKMTAIVGLFVGGLLLAELATGQQFGGGFGGGFNKGGRPDPVQLVNNASVKKELEITEDQSAAIPDAVLKALGSVLNEKQFKRFRQIELQQRGVQAFADPAIQTSLKLTAAQKETVKTILDDNKKEAAELFPKGKGAAGGGFGKDFAEKSDNLKKETLEKLTGVLTLDQKTTWKALNGEAFKLETPQFGGAGAGFGNKKGQKKKGE